MVPGDAKDKWRPARIKDDDAQHFWDQDKIVGKWIGQNVKEVKHLGPVAWDSYYLFDGDAEWDETLGPIKATGSPVIRNTEDLAGGLEELLAD